MAAAAARSGHGAESAVSLDRTDISDVSLDRTDISDVADVLRQLASAPRVGGR